MQINCNPRTVGTFSALGASMIYNIPRIGFIHSRNADQLQPAYRRDVFSPRCEHDIQYTTDRIHTFNDCRSTATHLPPGRKTLGVSRTYIKYATERIQSFKLSYN